MEEDDLLRRSPSLQRLFRRRPSFSRPPIRTINSPRLTEDEAEMLTSPFLTYRTNYTYANSSCYNPDLPSKWAVPNLAYGAEEIGGPLHVSSPSFFYILWSYFVWILEVIIYCVQKVFHTLFRKGPISLLVLLYDFCCFVYYSCKSVVTRTYSFVSYFLFGNAIHQGRSFGHVFKKFGYFLVSVLLLPLTAAHWLLDATGKGAYSIYGKMTGRQQRYNLRPYRRQASMEREHVRFSPLTLRPEDDDDDIYETGSTYSAKTRSARPVHNLRSRMITEMVTDSEDSSDEGFSEKHQPEPLATPKKSAMKGHHGQFIQEEEEIPSSKAVRIAHFLGSTASTIVSGIYWVLIEILTFVNRIIYGSKHRVKHMLTRSGKDSNTKAMHTRRTTTRRLISAEDKDIDDYEYDYETYYDNEDQKPSKLFYPFNLASDAVTNVLYGIMKIILAVIFALVDIVRFFRRLAINAAYTVYNKARSAVFGLKHVELPNGDDLQESVANMSDNASTVLWAPYQFFNWLGMKTMDTWEALGDKKRLLLWLLPLLLLLLILLARHDDHYPAPLENVKEHESLGERAAHYLSPDGKITEKVKGYFHEAQDSAVKLKDHVADFFGHGGRSTWTSVTKAPSYVWKTLKNGPSGLWNVLTDTWHTARDSTSYIVFGVWDTVKFSVYFMYHLARSIFHDVILGGLRQLWNTIRYGFYFTEYFVRAVWKDIIWKGLTKAWDFIQFCFYFVIHFTRAIYTDILRPTIGSIWHNVKFGFYFITHFFRSIFVDIISPVLSYIWEKLSFGFYFIVHFVRNIYSDLLSPIVNKTWEGIKFCFYFVAYFVRSIVGDGIYSVLAKVGEYIQMVFYFLTYLFRDIFIWSRNILPRMWNGVRFCYYFTTHFIDGMIFRRDQKPVIDTTVEIDPVQHTAYEYYQSIPTIDRMPEIPELPLQLNPSYYKDYVPTQENVSSSLWWILSMPKHFVDYTKSVFIEEKDLNVPPVPPGDETAGIVNPPPPPAAIPKIDEEKIISEVMKKLKIPEIDMKKIIKEVAEKIAPKQDREMLSQETAAKSTLPQPDEARIIKEVTEKIGTHKVSEDKIIQEVTSKLQLDMELKIKQMMDDYEKRINAVNVKHNNIEIDYTHLEALIRSAIYKYDADKTGLFDYALESAGASVISTRCSESYNTYSRLEKIWNIPLWYSSYGPRTVIQRNSNSLFPGECWSFKTGRGYLTIDLSHHIKIGSISYEHISAEQAPDKNRSSAPKTFDFWAYKTENDIAGRFLLGSYEYKLDEHPLQVFIIKNQPDFPVKIVEMEVTSNHGADFTCLYRLRVHGDIYRD